MMDNKKRVKPEEDDEDNKGFMMDNIKRFKREENAEDDGGFMTDNKARVKLETDGEDKTKVIKKETVEPGPAHLSLSQNAYEQSQVADQERIDWAWRLIGKVREMYRPVVNGKWWFRTEVEWSEMKMNKRHDFSHIGRIMETELGKKLADGDRCVVCRSLNQECWVYTLKGAQQISRPGSACARCRVAPRAGGCSLSTRTPQRNEPILPSSMVVLASKTSD